MRLTRAVAELLNHSDAMLFKGFQCPEVDRVGSLHGRQRSACRKSKSTDWTATQWSCCKSVCSVHLSQLSPPGVMSGEQEEGQVLNRQVKGSRVGSLYSSDTSYDSSASSDLEVG